MEWHSSTGGRACELSYGRVIDMSCVVFYDIVYYSGRTWYLVALYYASYTTMNLDARRDASSRVRVSLAYVRRGRKSELSRWSRLLRAQLLLLYFWTWVQDSSVFLPTRHLRRRNVCRALLRYVYYLGEGAGLCGHDSGLHAEFSTLAARAAFPRPWPVAAWTI